MAQKWLQKLIDVVKRNDDEHAGAAADGARDDGKISSGGGKVSATTPLLQNNKPDISAASAVDDAATPINAAAASGTSPQRRRKRSRRSAQGSDDDDDDDAGQLRSSVSLQHNRGSWGSTATNRSSFWAKMAVVRRRAPYYVPVISWLSEYRWKEQLPSDLLAGLAVSTLLIPQSLAYSILAGLPPQSGLYTAFVPIVVYFFLGHSRVLSIGPEALMAILVGMTLGQSPPAERVLQSHLLSFGTGLLVMVLGLLRLGFLDVIISRPLLCGFTNAVALTIVVEQVDALVGMEDHEHHGWQRLPYLFEHWRQINVTALVIGVCSLAFLFLSRYVKAVARRRWPAFTLLPDALIVCAVGILLAWGCDLERTARLPLLGEVSPGLPQPSVPWAGISTFGVDKVQAVVVMSVLGFIESIVAAKIYAVKANLPLSPNRELVAYGASNLVGSFFGAFPVFGSLPRTAMADMAGAGTQMSSLVCVLMVLLTMLFLGPVFAFLPRTSAAALITSAAIGLFELHDIVFLWRLRAGRELVLLTVTFLLTVGVGVELGLMLSLLISMLMILRSSSLPHLKLLGRLPGTDKYKDVTEYPDAELVPGVLVIGIGEALFFTNVAAFKEMADRLERCGAFHAHPGETLKSAKPPDAIVFHCGSMPTIDATALTVFSELVQSYRDQGVRVCFVKLHDKVKRSFVLAGIIGSTGASDVFSSTQSALIEVLGGVSFPGFRSHYIEKQHV